MTPTPYVLYLLKVLDHFTNCFKSFAGGYCTTTVEAIDISQSSHQKPADPGFGVQSSRTRGMYSMHPSEMLPKLLTHQDDVGSRSLSVNGTAHRKEAGHAPDCPITSWDDSAIASQADQLCYERFRVFMLWKST
ncbi:hypothetical protein ABKN59_003558 [Abortiporus biennis]